MVNGSWKKFGESVICSKHSDVRLENEALYKYSFRYQQDSRWHVFVRFASQQTYLMIVQSNRNPCNPKETPFPEVY